MTIVDYYKKMYLKTLSEFTYKLKVHNIYCVA